MDFVAGCMGGKLRVDASHVSLASLTCLTWYLPPPGYSAHACMFKDLNEVLFSVRLQGGHVMQTEALAVTFP